MLDMKLIYGLFTHTKVYDQIQVAVQVIDLLVLELPMHSVGYTSERPNSFSRRPI